MSQSLDQQLDQYRLAGQGQVASGGKLTQWALYAAATSSALSMATGADAAVVYSGTLDTTFPFAPPPGTTTSFDLDGGLPDLTINLSSAGGYLRAGASAFDIATTNFGDALGLNAGATIDDGLNFASQANLIAFDTFFGTNQGPLGVDIDIFLGIRTDQLNFAWLRISFDDTDGDNAPNVLRLVDFAFEDSGAPLDAGEGIPDEPSEVPVPAPLALLAAGAVGIASLRRRRQS